MPDGDADLLDLLHMSHTHSQLAVPLEHRIFRMACMTADTYYKLVLAQGKVPDMEPDTVAPQSGKVLGTEPDMVPGRVEALAPDTLLGMVEDKAVLLQSVPHKALLLSVEGIPRDQ